MACFPLPGSDLATHTAVGKVVNCPAHESEYDTWASRATALCYGHGFNHASRTLYDEEHGEGVKDYGERVAPNVCGERWHTRH